MAQRGLIVRDCAIVPWQERDMVATFLMTVLVSIP